MDRKFWSIDFLTMLDPETMSQFRMMRWLRQCRNAIRFKWVLLRAASAAAFQHQKWSNAEREDWLHQYSPDVLKAFGVEVTTYGVAPASGLVVSNHLSYLDILTLSAVFSCSFVSKDDVERWPLVGWLCLVAGTIFLDRRSRGDTVRVNDLVIRRLLEGSPVVVFPEGTSTDGSAILPFKSSLLQPAIDARVSITPLHISYSVEEGDAATEVCYWGNMVFLPHLWHMLGTKGIKATVHIGAPQYFADRKSAAMGSREAVVAMSKISPIPTRAEVAARLW